MCGTKARAWYEALFQQGRLELVKGEYSNTYFSSPTAGPRIQAWYPRIKLFVCLRNPVERAFSHYLQDLKIGHISPDVSFEEALEDHPEYIAWGRYRQHLECYLNLFDPAQMLVLVFDDLSKNPTALIETLYRFLGVDDGFVPSVLNRRVNVSRMPRWRAVDRWIQRTAHVLRYNKAGAWVWWQVKKTGLPRALKKWNTAAASMPVLSGEMQSHLRAVFDGDIEYVKGFFGKSRPPLVAVIKRRLFDQQDPLVDRVEPLDTALGDDGVVFERDAHFLAAPFLRRCVCKEFDGEQVGGSKLVGEAYRVEKRDGGADAVAEVAYRVASDDNLGLVGVGGLVEAFHAGESGGFRGLRR